MNEWQKDKSFRPRRSEINLRPTYHAPGIAGLKKPDSSGAPGVARELHSRATAEARKEIDWEEVRARLRQGELALERASTPDPQRVEAVYRQRAAQLAGRRAQAGAVSPPLPVLTFYLGEERYGIELTALAEVVPFAGCTPLPGASPEVLGVVNARGEVRPVVDLARLIGLPEGGASGYVLFLRGEGAGLRVGRVEQVEQVRPEELTAPGEGGVGLPTRCVKGLVPKTLILLDLRAILEHPILREVSRP